MEGERDAEEAIWARARKMEAVPSEMKLEEHNLDHAAFRRWCPHCVKTRSESYGHVRKVQGEGGVLFIGIDDMFMRSEQEKEEEKEMPTLATKDTRRS